MPLAPSGRRRARLVPLPLALLFVVAAAAPAAATPVPTFTPSPIDFGAHAVKTTSAAIPFVIFNPGPGSLTFTGFTVDGPFAVQGLPSFPISLADNAKIAGTATFSPTASGAASGHLVLQVQNGPDASVDLVGVGYTPAIALADTAVHFGAVTTGVRQVIDVVVKSTGDGPLTISLVHFSGLAAADFSLAMAPPFPVVVPAGGSTTLHVAVRALEHGPRKAMLSIASDDPNAPVTSIALDAVATGPKIAVSPSPLDFGAVALTTTGSASLTVTNGGETDLTVTQIKIAGDAAAEFSTAAMLPITVAAGQSVTVPFAFAPSKGGLRTATATVVSSDALAPSVDVPLVGVGGGALLSVLPPSIDFGPLAVATTSTVKLTILDKGNGPLVIQAVTVGGADADRFTVATPALPATVQPGNSITLSVTFSPTQARAYAGKITIVSNDPMVGTYDVPLAGLGATPTISADATTVDFAGQVVGKASPVRDLIVGNQGGVPLTVTSVMLAGPQAAAFALVAPPMTPFTLAPGETRTLHLQFTPTAMGPAAATLALASNDVGHPILDVALVGVGVGSAFLVDPAGIDFGQIEVPGTATRKVTITNTSGNPITLVDASLGGANPEAFSVTSAAGALDPGKSRVVTVTFTAAAAGTFAADLTIKAADNALPTVVVKLAGQGGAIVQVAPPSIDFGGVALGARGAAKITVSNFGTRFVQVQSVASSSALFSTVATSFPAIAPNSALSIDVVFAPTALGAASGKVRLTFVGGVSAPVEVAVAGVGLQPAPPPPPPMSSGCSIGGGGAARAPRAGGQEASVLIAGAALFLLVGRRGRRGRRRWRRGPADGVAARRRSG